MSSISMNRLLSFDVDKLLSFKNLQKFDQQFIWGLRYEDLRLMRTRITGEILNFLAVSTFCNKTLQNWSRKTYKELPQEIPVLVESYYNFSLSDVIQMSKKFSETYKVELYSVILNYDCRAKEIAKIFAFSVTYLTDNPLLRYEIFAKLAKQKKCSTRTKEKIITVCANMKMKPYGNALQICTAILENQPLERSTVKKIEKAAEALDLDKLQRAGGCLAIHCTFFKTALNDALKNVS